MKTGNSNTNDLCIFLLLSFKENKSKDDELRISKLKKYYPDMENVDFRDVRYELLSKKFIYETDLSPELPTQTPSGAVVPYDPQRYKYTTTKKGIDALNTDYYPSELESRHEDKFDASQKRIERELNIKNLKSTWAFWMSILAIVVSVLSLLQSIGLLSKWLSQIQL